MQRSASDATPADHGVVSSDARLADALRSLADQLAATHDALGSLVASVATEAAPVVVGPAPTAPARVAPAPVAPAPAAAPARAMGVPDGLTPHLRSVEALLAS
jgi:2-oxoglutarate dehydrogenase E2 component (dihydrolipoamide succinyltransferase)